MPKVGSVQEDMTSAAAVRAMAKTQKAWQELSRQSRGGNQTWDAISQTSRVVILRYLFKWTASIYRLIWVDVLVWLLLYYTVSFVYRFALNDDQKTVMEDLIRMTSRWAGEIPVTFLLGFFVSNVVSRWWDMYIAIPRMGGVSSVIRSCFRNGSNQKEAEELRLHIARYLNLSWLLCIMQYSGILKERLQLLKSIVATVNELEDEGVDTAGHCHHFGLFKLRKPNDQLLKHLRAVRYSDQLRPDQQPDDAAASIAQQLSLLNEDPVVKATFGDLITASEVQVFASQARKHWSPGQQAPALQWWIPLFWANALAERALAKGYVPANDIYAKLVDAMYGFGGQLTTLSNYAMRRLPVVYLQVVIVAVYTTYFAKVITHQFIDPTRAAARSLSGYWIDYYFPAFALLQLVFLIGWFKVAMVVMEPFGTDDEDFPLSCLLSANLRAGIAMCGSKAALYPEKLRPALKPMTDKQLQQQRHPEACVTSDCEVPEPDYSSSDSDSDSEVEEEEIVD